MLEGGKTTGKVSRVLELLDRIVPADAPGLEGPQSSSAGAGEYLGTGPIKEELETGNGAAVRPLPYTDRDATRIEFKSSAS